MHVDDVAKATALAIGSGAPGIYNVTDDEPVLASTTRARGRARTVVGARPPSGASLADRSGQPCSHSPDTSGLPLSSRVFRSLRIHGQPPPAVSPMLPDTISWS